ncbi:DUF4307 domain-containing protein [Mycolicibacterium sp.]|uniref:DUF4307 domain-containing protein n=1 Tax=Mycolicibacterium sp. TaxID=2320850 RepID=UPI0028A957C6|nr:DUF4307 domain-containing protein [Mycolicibacterium sp.]
MTDTPAGRPDPASRYGRQSMSAQTRGRIVKALGALTVLAGLGFAVVAYQRFEGKDVEATSASYELIDDRTVAVTISVTRKDPSVPVVCIVRARSRDAVETGRREILVGPSQSRTVHVTANVTAYDRPLGGDLYGCGTEVPAYLTAP